MCQSIEEGGLRCGTHSGPALERAYATGDVHKIRIAQREHNLTKKAQDEMRANGDNEMADRFARERKARSAFGRENGQFDDYGRDFYGYSDRGFAADSGLEQLHKAYYDGRIHEYDDYLVDNKFTDKDGFGTGDDDVTDADNKLIGETKVFAVYDNEVDKWREWPDEYRFADVKVYDESDNEKVIYVSQDMNDRYAGAGINFHDSAEDRLSFCSGGEAELLDYDEYDYNPNDGNDAEEEDD